MIRAGKLKSSFLTFNIYGINGVSLSNSVAQRDELAPHLGSKAKLSMESPPIIRALHHCSLLECKAKALNIGSP